MRLLVCFGLLLFALQINGQRAPIFSKESAEVDSSEHGDINLPGRKGTTCACGWANKNSKRMVGGKETKVNEYPFMVALVDHLRRVFCGGSILTPSHVLTAAHCTIAFLKGRWMSVALGEHDMTRHDETIYTQLIPVKKILQHGDYDDTTIANDISILVLQNEMKFNQFVGPICISPVRMNLDNQYVKVIGWGKTHHNATATSNVLNHLNLRIVPSKKCSEFYPYHVDASKGTQVCTHSNEKGSCKGDSGGPLVWLDPETNRYTQVGIVSFGRICGGVDPSVYTYPTAYWSWIQKSIEDSTPAGKNYMICVKQ